MVRDVTQLDSIQARPDATCAAPLASEKKVGTTQKVCDFFKTPIIIGWGNRNPISAGKRCIVGHALVVEEPQKALRKQINEYKKVERAEKPSVVTTTAEAKQLKSYSANYGTATFLSKAFCQKPLDDQTLLKIAKDGSDLKSVYSAFTKHAKIGFFKRIRVRILSLISFPIISIISDRIIEKIIIQVRENLSARTPEEKAKLFSNLLKGLTAMNGFLEEYDSALDKFRDDKAINKTKEIFLEETLEKPVFEQKLYQEFSKKCINNFMPKIDGFFGFGWLINKIIANQSTSGFALLIPDILQNGTDNIKSNKVFKHSINEAMIMQAKQLKELLQEDDVPSPVSEDPAFEQLQDQYKLLMIKLVNISKKAPCVDRPELIQLQKDHPDGADAKLFRYIPNTSLPILSILSNRNKLRTVLDDIVHATNKTLDQYIQHPERTEELLTNFLRLGNSSFEKKDVDHSLIDAQILEQKDELVDVAKDLVKISIEQGAKSKFTPSSKRIENELLKFHEKLQTEVEGYLQKIEHNISSLETITDKHKCISIIDNTLLQLHHMQIKLHNLIHAAKASYSEASKIEIDTKLSPIIKNYEKLSTKLNLLKKLVTSEIRKLQLEKSAKLLDTKINGLLSTSPEKLSITEIAPIRQLVKSIKSIDVERKYSPELHTQLQLIDSIRNNSIQKKNDIQILRSIEKSGLLNELENAQKKYIDNPTTINEHITNEIEKKIAAILGQIESKEYLEQHLDDLRRITKHFIKHELFAYTALFIRKINRTCVEIENEINEKERLVPGIVEELKTKTSSVNRTIKSDIESIKTQIQKECLEAKNVSEKILLETTTSFKYKPKIVNVDQWGGKIVGYAAQLAATDKVMKYLEDLYKLSTNPQFYRGLTHSMMQAYTK
jgi:hypothetical protein